MDSTTTPDPEPAPPVPNVEPDGLTAEQEARVQVKFFTREPEFAVPDAPILVPTSFKRYGLSQIINHLLATETPTPFDFLTDGAFLRSSLAEHLNDKGLSSEITLSLEYVRATIPPNFLSSFEHDDWVSSVAVSPATTATVLSGSYDGLARVWNQSGEVLAVGSGHTSAIKTVAWVGEGEDGAFATGSMDRTVQLWNYDAEDGTATATAELLGHRSMVLSLAAHPGTRRLLSAGADGAVLVWNTDFTKLPAAPAELITDAPRNKKRKLSAASIPRCGALATLAGHTSPAAAIRIDPRDATVAYSVGWDHTIRTWDLTMASSVDVRTTQHPLFSLCVLRTLGVLACGTAARHITLHDPRAQAITATILRGHTNAVVALSPAPDNDFQMVSASHDGSVRVWDVRAAAGGNLFTVKREKGGYEKVFDVEWSRVGLVSAGEDKTVQFNEVPHLAGTGTGTGTGGGGDSGGVSAGSGGAAEATVGIGESEKEL